MAVPSFDATGFLHAPHKAGLAHSRLEKKYLLLVRLALDAGLGQRVPVSRRQRGEVVGEDLELLLAALLVPTRPKTRVRESVSSVS